LYKTGNLGITLSILKISLEKLGVQPFEKTPFSFDIRTSPFLYKILTNGSVLLWKRIL